MKGTVDDALRLRYLEAIGIQLWTPKMEFPIKPGALELIKEADKDLNLCPEASKVTKPLPIKSDDKPLTEHCDWKKLQQQVSGCTACNLHKTRTQTVFGVGNVSASWMVIGEAPGVSEDQQGEPFVGKAGMLLNEMLRAIKMRREDVFIANILKCRPPRNRDPSSEEVDACEPFLKQQVATIKPKIILAVGRVAAQNLLKTDTPIGRLRGKLHYYGDIPVVVLYHPAYLLRSPLEKRRAWDDLLFAIKMFAKNA